MEAINCPKCSAPMTPVTIDSTVVDRCTGCGGLWFDAGEDSDASTASGVDALDPAGATRNEARDAQTRVACPRCHTPMIRLLDRRTREIWYENCPICFGRFFDAGEFRAIQPVSFADAMKRFLRGDPA